MSGGKDLAQVQLGHPDKSRAIKRWLSAIVEMIVPLDLLNEAQISYPFTLIVTLHFRHNCLFVKISVGILQIISR